MRRFILLILATALAACGGSSGDAAETTTTQAEQPNDGGEAPETTTTTEPATTVADTGDATEGGGDMEDAEAPGGVAMLEIGEYRYEFNATPGTLRRCDPNFFNAFWVIAIEGDGLAGSGVEMLLPPEDDPNHEDAPRVEVTDDQNGIDWIANPDSLIANADRSLVDSWTVEGRSVRGTATFLKAGDTNQGEFVTGTFEVTCPPEE